MELIGFGDLNFEDYGFWTGLIDGALPYPTARHNLIERPGMPPVFGVPTIDARRIPVEIGYRSNSAFSTITEAFDFLMTVLRPLDPTPRELRARREDGTIVALTAVVELPAGINPNVNVISATFITVDTEWVSLTPVSMATTFSDPLDQSFLLSSAMVSSDPGRIMLSFTTQRTESGAQYGAKYHKSITLTNGSDNAWIRFPVLLPAGDTEALVTGSKALANGDDFRVVVGGLEVPRSLKNWNTTDTGVWVLVPVLQAGDSMTFDLIYGNPDMGQPPELEYPNLPVFSLSESTQSELVWDTEDVAANASKGLWWLSSGIVEPQIDQAVPGAWQIVQTKGAAEDFVQARSTQYVDTDTYYRATFQARRSKAGGINPQDNRNGDGVGFYSPLPIESIEFGYRYRNDREGLEGTLPVGMFVALTRTGLEPWAPVTTRSSLSDGTWEEVTSDVYAISGGPNEVALAVWPYNQIAVRAGVVTGREINVYVDTDIKVTVDDSAVQWGTLSEETEIYEVANRVVTYEDGTDRIARVAVLGIESGGRLFIPLGNTIVIDGLYRTVEEWNDTADEFVRTIPPTSYLILQKVAADEGFETIETASDAWPNPLAPTNIIPNGSFTTSVDGWSRRSASGGITSSGPTHEGTVTSTAPGAMKTVITASSGGVGTGVVEQLTAKLPINGQYNITISADSRTSTDELTPLLGIAFYDHEEALIEELYEESYTPIADTWRRRLVSVEVPDGAITYQILLRADTRVANATGTVYWDDVVTGGAEIVLVHRPDDVPGTVIMTYSAYPSFA